MIITIQGITEDEHHSVTTAVSKAIEAAGAHMVDSREFSNIAVSYGMKIPTSQFGQLRRELEALNIVLTPAGANELRVSQGSENHHDEVVASLKLSFRRGELRPHLDTVAADH